MGAKPRTVYDGGKPIITALPEQGPGGHGFRIEYQMASVRGDIRVAEANARLEMHKIVQYREEAYDAYLKAGKAISRKDLDQARRALEFARLKAAEWDR